MKKCLFALLVACLLIALSASPVFAIADPNTPPAVNAVYVYEDLLEDGDVGVLVEYFLDYDPVPGIPTETVTEAYLTVFVNTDGTTQLKSVAPYTFVDSGYGMGLAWIYFTAAEAATYSLTSANQALYRIWLVGNPTLAWAGDPPKTIAGIDQWNTTGDPAVLLALRVLYYADVLELTWSPSLDMVAATALGNRLTTAGESYFTNVITNLRTMAPSAFSAGLVEPTLEDIDYSVAFGATATGAIVNGTPVTLASGANTLNILANGTFTLDLEAGTYGTITGGTATISGGVPSDLVPGVNSIVVTGGTPGTLIMTVALASTQQTLTGNIIGTGFDLTTVAARFGMSRLMFSGLLWFIITLIICAATYRWESGRDGSGLGAIGSGKTTMLMFGLSLIGGTLMGMLDMRVVAVLAILYGAFIGYILFFRTSADIGRTVMFMGWMWFVVCLVGGVLAGITPQTSTRLTADITAVSTTLNVTSTEGFRSAGIITIGEERIAYHKTSATTFTGTFFRPLIRGTQGTEAAAHVTGASVRSAENAMLNDTLSYNVALLSDASGLMFFVSLPLVFWDMLTSFIFLPLSFLGTDMVVLTYIWGIVGLGLLTSAVIAVLGGRRV